MKTYELKSINTLSLATAMGVCMGTVGILYSIVSFLTLNEETAPHLRYLIFLAPPFMTSTGMVTGLFYAWVINISTKHVRSIRFTVSEISEGERRKI